MREPIVVNAYSGLAHKELVAESTGQRWAAASWVPVEDRQRLAAYIVRAAFLSNTARQTLPHGTPDEVRRAVREYGDAALLRDRVMAGVLGTDWSITVDGADADPLTDGPALPPMPDPLPAVVDAAAQAVIDTVNEERLEAWRAQVVTAADEWRADTEAQGVLRGREQAVRAWADRSHLSARIHEAEQKAVGLGDAVIVLWPRTEDWPEVQVIDPGFYFPALDVDGSWSAYPDRVNLAWEYEDDDGRGGRCRFLRRITFELVFLQTLRAGFDDLGRPAWIDERGQPSLVPVARPDERVDPAGIVHRRYPWDPDDLPPERWSTRTCIVSDGAWDLSRTSISGLADLSEAAATWRTLDDGRVIHRLDMGVDFLPVVHLPNTPTGEEHYGTSVIDPVAQVLDDIASNDSDVMSAGRFIGAPTVAMTGREAVGETMLPGRIINLGENGTMIPLDLSAGIDKLMVAGDRLQDRMWQSGKVPAEVLGRAESGDVAGVTLALRFAPFGQLVGVLRMARDPKYRLLFRMAQRLAQVQGVLEPGPTPETRMRWGNFMPTDRNATITAVAEAVQAHVMSTQIAVAMLVAAGLPIDDARAEVDRIHAEDTEAANQLADALAGAPGAAKAVAERLGVELDAAEPPLLSLPDLDDAA